ncbi:hypothetical protein [Fodinibius sediminis]|uniref:Uncharacterized protein n=1 Tax=Fodinibius sediminis TaxID=1214077 RepID=A0A521BU56_9BACT|nr:hypothetical protein [Fodinibius sediminis]SMO50686.1 hypothetical protein SAMN06265218_10433 [Fodinibius sediminis]
MRHLRSTYRQGIQRLTVLLLLLFGLHFLSVHGFASALVLCFEDNGQINIESEAGALFSIPSEDTLHANTEHDHAEPTFDSASGGHHDVNLSVICSKEQQTTRFDQENMLQFLDGILNSRVEDLPPSRVFQFVSYTPPLIEDTITASLKTVVRILYN